MPHLYAPRVCLGALVLLAACPDLINPADSASASATTTATGEPATTTTTAPDPTTGFEPLCLPGQTRCDPGQANVLQTCKATGTEWESSPCAHQCVDDIESSACAGPCDTDDDPTSIGCEFLAIRMDSHNGPDEPDALIVGNTDPDELAAVQLYYTPANDFTEQAILDPVILAPGESHVFDITVDPLAFTSFRNGGVFRLVSDRPVAAYLHSPLANDSSNDASMLLPVRWLRKDYVVASWPPFVDAAQPDTINGRPSYFTVIALEDDTTVTWQPRQRTAGFGTQFEAVEPGATGTKVMHRFDVLQVAASSPPGDTDYVHHDVSGTLVSADKNIWVMGATDCAYVPFGSGWCNHLQEQMIPLEYWGSTYIGPPSPPRSGTEKQYWRVYAGDDDVTLAITNSGDANTEFKMLAERGEFVEVEADFGVSLLFVGLNDAPILPVQYLAGNEAAGGIGDPAMIQMIAVEQWRDRYVFVTGADYEANFVQIVRRTGGADVTIDGQVVGDWKLANFAGDDNYQIADFPLPGGADAITSMAASTEPFGIHVIGYNPAGPGDKTSAYAYPGGMRLEKLFVP
ncbi:IgGFc-binding protein [Nannocystis bainbridge]|uniref:IgGFc-binding protein n=1 Tax=Nannocystis bainbridge TaxID=2995303 RepID=A0ABT5DYU3_9BACT|nr:IgGFc-binding protein [Nannocystis bainbridge]MDC0717616.1 IgGFc-binding protein [Nannocystis bainbridge]